MTDRELSNKLSQSTCNNSQILKSQSKSPCFKKNNIIINELDDFSILKKEKKELRINKNKYDLLKNRISNLQQLEQSNLKQIELIKQKEKKKNRNNFS